MINWNKGTLTLTLTSPDADVMQSGGTVVVDTKGGTITLNGGNDTVITNGKVLFLDIGGGAFPLPAHLTLKVSGVLGGAIDSCGNNIEIMPMHSGSVFAQSVSLSTNGQTALSSAGTITFDMVDNGPVVSVGAIRGTLDYKSMAFLQGSHGVSFNDGCGPDGINLPAGASNPGSYNMGSMPTLEIDHLKPLKDIRLTQASLTLDFKHGASVTLNNVSVNDPKFFTAEQTASGSLYLSEAVLPAGGKAVQVIPS